MDDEVKDFGEIRYLGDLQRLPLKSDDMLVLSVETCLSMDQRNHLRDYLEAVVPGHKVIVLCDGMKLGVVSPDTGHE